MVSLLVKGTPYHRFFDVMKACGLIVGAHFPCKVDVLHRDIFLFAPKTSNLCKTI